MLAEYDFQIVLTPCQEPLWSANVVIVTASVQTCCFLPTAHQNPCDLLTQQATSITAASPPAPSALHPSSLGVIHEGCVASISTSPQGRDRL